MSRVYNKKFTVDSTEYDAHIEMYDSAQEVASDCAVRPVHISRYRLSDDDISESSTGVKSYAEALDLLRHGYQPVVDDLRTALQARPGEGSRFTFANNIKGYAPVVPLAIKGIPNCMLDTSMKSIKVKVIDVYYDITSSWDTSPEQFIDAGKKLLSTIISLEKQGYRFNLYAVQAYNGTCGSKHTSDILCIKVKSSRTPIDLKRISFPFTHPAFFRVIGWDWQGKSPITRDIGNGRGHALAFDAPASEIEVEMKKMFGPNISYVPAASIIKGKYSVDDMIRSFKNDIKRSRDEQEKR